MSKPTLKEAVDCYRDEPWMLKFPKSHVMAKALDAVAKLYQWIEEKRKHCDAGGIPAMHLYQISTKLKEIGIDTLVETRMPNGDWIEDITNTDDPNVVCVAVRCIDGTKVTYRMARKPLLERIQALKDKSQPACNEQDKLMRRCPMRKFGPYLIEIEGKHATISTEDGSPAEPTFYEMQHIKCLAFGGRSVAIEIFPDTVDLVDGQNQRHLWLVDKDGVPNLRNGHLTS